MQIFETKNSQYKITIKGYYKRTPVILKYIADFVIFALMPAGDALIIMLPEIESKVWWMFGWGCFCSLFKLVTKFIEEFPKPDKNITGETINGTNVQV